MGVREGAHRGAAMRVEVVPELHVTGGVICPEHSGQRIYG
jgi:hypothetical protein